jgi:hypothetical protein
MTRLNRGLLALALVMAVTSSSAIRGGASELAAAEEEGSYTCSSCEDRTAGHPDALEHRILDNCCVPGSPGCSVNYTGAHGWEGAPCYYGHIRPKCSSPQ